jgi:sulfhydrogenase subunit beta (sulfur reductase)
MAFLGVRACELHAIGIQDRVFLKGPFVDRHYQERRDQVCIIAVSCGQAGNTCFCTSMGTGPRVDGADVDLSLVELLDAGRHDFLFQIGSQLGADLLKQVPHRAATEQDLFVTDSILAQTAASMGREMITAGLVDLLKSRPDHPRWNDVASRCLTCTNCTMVCPTCFCTAVQDTTDLTGQTAERWRLWDSCFTLDFSHIVGGSIRTSTMSRYRQWMTHKLATWVDQFGTSGCVGCGRCITWCPVGIDITAEVAAIQASPQAGLPAAANSDAPAASTRTGKRSKKKEEPAHE